jgi:hypothetical protein
VTDLTGNADTARYGLRRVMPFLGTTQVIEAEFARAISFDGRTWQIQLQPSDPVSMPVWGNIGPRQHKRLYFIYAHWSRQEGLRRQPLDPRLGDPSGYPSLPVLMEALESGPPLPFPLADRLELWLLDRENGGPVALVASAVEASGRRSTSVPTWAAPTWRDLGLRLRDPGLLSVAGAYDLTPGQRSALAEQVRERVGQRPGACWFRRDAEGNGLPLDDSGAEAEGDALHERREFPALLLREDWSRPESVRTVRELFDWLAPMLLTLEGLDHGTRSRLERAAVRQPFLLLRYCRLLPEIIQRDIIDAALVEGRMRLAHG